MEECKYLGVSLKSAKAFGCSIKERIKKFYRYVNAIFRIDGHSDVMLKLVEISKLIVFLYKLMLLKSYMSQTMMKDVCFDLHTTPYSVSYSVIAGLRA